jgi:hypothetical protein
MLLNDSHFIIRSVSGYQVIGLVSIEDDNKERGISRRSCPLGQLYPWYHHKHDCDTLIGTPHGRVVKRSKILLNAGEDCWVVIRGYWVTITVDPPTERFFLNHVMCPRDYPKRFYLGPVGHLRLWNFEDDMNIVVEIEYRPSHCELDPQKLSAIQGSPELFHSC